MKYLLITLLFTLVNNSFAFNGGTRKIDSIGCHSHDRICYVYVAGEPVGPKESCVSNSFRWSADTDPNHNEILSLLTAAFMAEKSVSFTLESDCFSLQPTVPAIRYIIVSK